MIENGRSVSIEQTLKRNDGTTVESNIGRVPKIEITVLAIRQDQVIK